jgi:hypothetical protein
MQRPQTVLAPHPSHLAQLYQDIRVLSTTDGNLQLLVLPRRMTIRMTYKKHTLPNFFFQFLSHVRKSTAFKPNNQEKNKKPSEIAQNRQISVQWYNCPHRTQKHARDKRNGIYNNPAASDTLWNFYFFSFSIFSF